MPIVYESHEKLDKDQTPHAAVEQKRGKAMGLFSHSAFKPSDIRFDTQEREETVELVLRPHIITNLPHLIAAAILVLTPVVIVPLLAVSGALPFRVPAGYSIVLTLFWYVIVFGFLLTSYMRWFFNIYIVSDQRILDIDFVQLLMKRFSYTQLSRIQDITFTQSGFFRTLFDYGHVFIQTASADDNFDFLNVAHPQKVVEKITEVAARRGIKLQEK